MVSNCPDRLRLDQIVAEATKAMYTASSEYQIALDDRPPDHNVISQRLAVLDACRRVVSKAQRDLDGHVKEHGCKKAYREVGSGSA